MPLDFSKLKKHEKYNKDFGNQFYDQKPADITDRVMQRANTIINKNSMIDTIKADAQSKGKVISIKPTQEKQNNNIKQYVEDKNAKKGKIGNKEKNTLNDIKNVFSNFGLGVKKAEESSLSYIESMSNNLSGYKKYNQNQARFNKEKEQLKNLKQGKTMEGEETKNPSLPGLNLKQQEIKNIKNPILTKTIDNQDLESPINSYLNKKITSDEQKIQENIDSSSSQVSKKIAELMPSIAQSVTGMGVSAINPGLGLAYWQTSAGGDYVRDAKARGMKDEDALKYGTIMGAMEGVTEKIGAELTKGVGKAISKGGVVKGLKALGLDIGENFFEEAIMEPIQESVASITGGKDKANWNDMQKRIIQSGIDGALTSIIMGGASAGIGKATSLVGKMQEGKPITKEEIADTLKEINKKEEINIEKVLVNSFGFSGNDLYINKDAQQRTNKRLDTVASELSQFEVEKIIKNSDLSDDIQEKLTKVSEENNLNPEQVQYLIENTKNGKYNTEVNKIINESNLDDENKASLMRVAQKYNMSPKKVEELIKNNPNGVISQNQSFTMQNNEVLNNNQQIPQEQNKMTENGNIGQIEQNQENNVNPYKNTAKANKLIKEKNEKIAQLNNDLKNVTSEEAKKFIQTQIDNTEKNYNEQIQGLYNEINQDKIIKNLSKNGKFEEQLELYKNGKMKSSDLLYLGQTPEIYRKIGLKENPITLLQKDLKKVITEVDDETAHEHGISIDTLKNLPKSLENPLNILKSKDNNGNDCIVVITDLADTKERPIIASILIDDNGQIGNIHFDTNRLTSAYGKREYDRYMKKQIEAGNMLYDIDEGIIKESPASTGVQFPKGLDSSVDTVDNVSTSNNIIPQNENKMQVQTEKNNLPKKQEAKLPAKSEALKMDSEEAKKAPTRHEVIQDYRKLAKENIGNISTWKDKSNGLRYQLETMERNMYDIIPDKEEAKKINDTYFEPIHEAEAEKQRFINKYNERIEQYDLNKYEAEAVQVLGEQKYNPEFDKQEAEKALNDVNKNIKKGRIDEEKVNKAIEEFRKIYDELFDIENETLKKYGYKEKPYRKGYFPHFIDYVPETRTEKVLNKLGFKIDKRALPTDIAGITEQFVPGKTWNRSALERKTNKTDYNALKGFDTYISQASDNIFHTENIQKLRGLENEIRYQYSDKGVQSRIDEILNDETLTQEEKQDLIDKKFEEIQNPLPNLVTELHRYTNALANKKSEADRSMEQSAGRAVYSTINALENRFGANAVGLNIGSAITNFIPITQAYSQVNTKNMGRAMLDTIKSYMKDDGFVDKSTFLTNRLNQADKLYKTNLEKVSEKTSFLFDAIDDITSNIVVRGKYLQNLQEGMSESEAMKNADRFASNVIADRSKGALPTKFEEKNPMTKMFTQFQLEVNNQFRYMFKDIPRDLQEKGMGAIALAFFKMFIGAWLYNDISEELIGRKPAFSPIDLIKSSVDTITDENMGTYDKIANMSKEVGEQAPFIGGLIGGGRVPVNGAIPNVANLTKAGVGLATGEMDSKKATDTLKKEMSKPLYYLIPPFGGGQAKKTIEGINTIRNGGSYTIDKNGKETLQFPVENPTAGDYVKAGIFGKYALPKAKDYVDSGFKGLNTNATKLYEESGIDYKTIKDYVDFSNKTSSTDENGYTKYEDKKGNVYWFDKNSQTLYDSDYNVSNIRKDSLEKSNNKEKLAEYINNLKISDDKKVALYKYNIVSSTKNEDGISPQDNMEYMLKNGMSNKDFIDTYLKASKEGITYPDKEEYDKIKNAGLSVDKYLDFKIDTKKSN